MDIQYLGHSGFRLIHNRTEIVIDPYLSEDERRVEQPKFDARKLSPDFILITHEHFDHCDPKVVKMLVNKHEPKVIGPPPLERKLGFKMVKVRPGNEFDYDDFILRVVPAFHERSEFPVGFLLDFDGLRVYHAGDTMYDKKLRDVSTDVALLPIGGTYTMNSDEALTLIDEMNPRLVIPMHYNTFDEIRADPYDFAQKNDKIVVLKEGGAMEVNP